MLARPAGEFDELAFAGFGGLQQAKLLQRSADAPTVVVLPALGIRASYYDGFLRELASHGLNAVIADFPGQGDSPVRASRSSNWSYGQLVEHAVALRSAVGEQLSGPLIWAGHSLGGQVALMASESDTVAGVALVASGSPYRVAFPGLAWSVRLRFAGRAFPALGRALGYFPGDRIGFGGREARDFIRDWAQVCRRGVYDFPGFHGESLFARTSTPILAITLDGDTWAPRRSAENLVAKTRAVDVQWWNWVPEEPVDHNRWPRLPAAPAGRIATWIESAVLA